MGVGRWENRIEEGESEVVGGDGGMRNQKPSIYQTTCGHSSLWVVMHPSITHSPSNALAKVRLGPPALTHVFSGLADVKHGQICLRKHQV